MDAHRRRRAPARGRRGAGAPAGAGLPGPHLTTRPLSDDSRVIALACSGLGSGGAGDRPLTAAEWSALAAAIHRSELRRPAALLGLGAGALERTLGVPADDAARLARLLDRGGQLAVELEHLADRGLWILTRADREYPSALRTRLRSGAPPLLFGAGAPALVGAACLAIVGASDAGDSALELARRLARRCAGEGLAVASTAAPGVGTEALVAAAGGAGAIGVAADALERVVRRRELREHLLTGRMAVVSPDHPSGSPTPGAPGAATIVHALASAAVVVATDGGDATWAGAVEHLEAGWTPLLVHAGDDAPEGNRALLAGGTVPLTAAALDAAPRLGDLLRAPAGDPRPGSAPSAEGG